ncbi:MAG: peptidoglycan-associated lipoprotein Pal [Minwuia sp.]|uniref:peptidoglycan-associated lipoprotein Pal n=1 Tax=Minwuia sp. TaxID=2493630 RepID=UPI003A8B9BD4
MRHGFLIKAGAVLVTAFLLAACGEDEPVTNTSNAGNSQATTPAPQQPVNTQPSGPAPGTQEHFVLNVGDRVFFATDRHDLDGDARNTLRRQAAYMAENPAISVVIEGHADERGTREYNLGLGDRRANAARDYLVSLGVQPNRVTTISYGKERPVALGHNEAAWSQNRRSVTIIGN